MVGIHPPPHKDRRSVGRLIFLFIGFVALGIPIVGYIWGILSDVLAGDVRGWPIAIGFAALLVLLGLMRWLGKKVTVTPENPPAAEAEESREMGLAPDEEPVTTGTFFLMLIFLMMIGGFWGLMYWTLLHR